MIKCGEKSKGQLTTRTKYVRCQSLWSVARQHGSQKGKERRVNGLTQPSFHPFSTTLTLEDGDTRRGLRKGKGRRDRKRSRKSVLSRGLRSKVGAVTGPQFSSPLPITTTSSRGLGEGGRPSFRHHYYRHLSLFPFLRVL